jgi:hypothetical protein
VESYFSIIHLALAVAAFVPILWPGGRKKLKTVWIGSLSLIALLAIYQGDLELSRRKDILAVKREVIGVLRDKSFMTFEQIFDCCYYRDLKVTTSAVAELIDEGLVMQSKRQIADNESKCYLVRIFSLPVAPVTKDVPQVALTIFSAFSNSPVVLTGQTVR